MALETRTFRDRDLHHLVFNFDPRRHLATESPLPFFAGFSGSVASSMPLDLIMGRPFSPFRWAISSRCSLTVCFRAATSPNSSMRWTPKTGQVAKRGSRLGTAGWPELRHGEYTEE